MQTTTNYKLKKPEGTDPINVADFNSNMDGIDTELAGRVKSAGGDVSNTKISTVDTISTQFPVPAAGENCKTFLGKVRKFIQDFNSLKTGIITVGKLVNNGLTTQSGIAALDAAMGKTLADKDANLQSQINQLNGDLRIKVLDVPCKEGKTETTALSAYYNIVTGMASLSNNNYIIGHLLINDKLIITSTVAHTVRVYYINIPNK